MPAEHGPRPAPASSEARAFLAQAWGIIQQLAVLVRNSYLHEPDNEVFHEPMDKLRSGLEELLRTEGGFELECIGTELFANGVRVRMEIRNLQVYRYVCSEITRRDLGGLHFSAPPERPAVARLLAVLLRHGEPGDDPVAELNAALEEAGVGEIGALPPRSEEFHPPGDRRQRAIETYQQALDFIRECMTELDSPAEINLRRAKRSIHKLVDLSFEEGEGFSLAGLAAIKSHNEYTFNHMVNVCVLSVAFGQRLGLSRSQLARLGLCALYHDMGKLSIPLEILEKHGPLNDEEWAVMGNHTVYGARTLFPVITADRDSVDRILATLQHHLGFDCSGYPKIRLLREQALFVRIVAIADAFDAMTTKRVYQKQFLPDEALGVMVKESGSRYDPLLLRAFINCMGVFPVGSLILLTSGELAVVCEPSSDPERLDRPTVKLVTDSQQQQVKAVLVDLSHPEQDGRRIARCVNPEEFGVNVAHHIV